MISIHPGAFQKSLHFELPSVATLIFGETSLALVFVVGDAVVVVDDGVEISVCVGFGAGVGLTCFFGILLFGTWFRYITI